MKTNLIFIILFIYVFSCQNEADYHFPGVNHPVQSYADELEYLYRIELLPQYRDQSEVGQISSYDTTGGNNDGFSGLYSYIRKEGRKRIIAELQGPGVIERIWTPTPSEDTLEFYFDGESKPRIRMRFIDLFSGDLFPFLFPVVGNEVGGYYSYIPIPYQRSCKIVYIGDRLYFHQIQYRRLPQASELKSFPIEWDEPEKDAIRKAVKLWTEKKPYMESYLDALYSDIQTQSISFTILPGDIKNLIDLNHGGRIIKFELNPADAFSGRFKDLLVRIQWDDEAAPAVYCPVADFFGYASGVPATQSILLGTDQSENYCFIPMPFDKKAKIELIYEKRDNLDQPALKIQSNIKYSLIKRNPEHEGKFYTQWKRVIHPSEGKPYVIQESDGKGHHIGTILQARGLKAGMTLFFEGDDSTVVDRKILLHGTGSEDYFNGGWYALPNRWDRSFSLPIHGCLEYSIPMARTGGYRFYLTDKISYRNHILHTIEHGPTGNQYPVDYTSIAYYYSDQPFDQVMEPEAPLREIYLPDTLIITPDLLKVTVGLYNAVSRIDWGEFLFHGEDQSLLVIHLDEIPKGEYQLFLSYLKNQAGCDFSTWQRQKRVSNKKSSLAKNEILVNQEYLGDITLNEQYTSVSIMKESAGSKEQLIFTSLMLVKK